MNKAKILHLVIDLSDFGGAEMTLLRYLSQTEAAAEHHAVLTLKAVKPGPSVGAEIMKLGVPVHSLSISGIKSMLEALPRLVQKIRKLQPEILSAWLYYPSLLATLLRPFLPHKPRLVWHIRSLPFVTFNSKPARWLAQRVLALLSHVQAVQIVSNSEASRKAHGAIGFRTSAATWTVIPNAVDTQRYAPNREARTAIRAELALTDTMIVIGAVGRNVPEKGYPDLFLAFEALRDDLPAALSERLHLMIAGRNVTPDDPSIKTLLARSRLPAERFHLLGPRQDIPDVLNAMDVFVMPSRSESFPNVLAEAMAVGLPALATDVGDCRVVLNDDRFIATPDLLARRMAMMLSLSAQERETIGLTNRMHIEERYTEAKMTAAFDAVFQPAAAMPNLK
jgi:glycosyltransferase involved in cell wall biosynthesis